MTHTLHDHDDNGDLLERLARHASERPDKLAFTYLGSHGEVAARMTYAELHTWVGKVSAYLSKALPAGERVVLLLPSGLEFIAAFLACLDAGLIAVPCSVPHNPQTATRLAGIIADCGAACVLTNDALKVAFASIEPPPFDLARISWHTIEVASATTADRPQRMPSDASSIAFIQYTSGSTTTPKGVLVSHGNLSANERMIQAAFEHHSESVVVGWLPLFHDQGLIGNVCQPLWIGAHCVLMAPQTYLKRPWLWLRAISDYRATTSGAPNFAYEHVLRTLSPERMTGVKLDTWRLAFNGAEPIQANTIDRFTDALAPYGFRSAAMFPCYGLAEATLFVTGGWPASRGFALECSREHLERAQARQVSGVPSLAVVRCGQPAHGLTLKIVRDGRECERREVGEVWLAGGSVAMGYWNKPDETRQAFDNRVGKDGRSYLRTGDLGFVDERDELFITGRVKELLIVEGRNHYPHDIEYTVQNCDDRLRNRVGAAFSIGSDGNERVVVVQEVKARGDALLRTQLASSIRRAVREEHGLGLHDVVLLGQGQVPKTTSGKIRRAEARHMFLSGQFAEE